jgi:hypothetical protein
VADRRLDAVPAVGEFLRAGCHRGLALSRSTSIGFSYWPNHTAVQQRLRELRQHLPSATRWMQVSATPSEPLGDGENLNCLRCQLSYLTAGVAIAQSVSAMAVAFGDAGYQSDWPEQTPEAQAVFTHELQRLGLIALFPIADIASKQDCKAELTRHGLTAQALEKEPPSAIQRRAVPFGAEVGTATAR